MEYTFHVLGTHSCGMCASVANMLKERKVKHKFHYLEDLVTPYPARDISVPIFWLQSSEGVVHVVSISKFIKLLDILGRIE